MGRAPCCDKASVKRGPWSPEEDTILKYYIHRHGTGSNWISLPHKADDYHFESDLNGGEFMYVRWSIIASQLPGTDNDVKNYWNTKLKKKLMTAPPPPKPNYLSLNTNNKNNQINHQLNSLSPLTCNNHPVSPFSYPPPLNFGSEIGSSSILSSVSQETANRYYPNCYYFRSSPTWSINNGGGADEYDGFFKEFGFGSSSGRPF
ncbi:hypothetical protein MKX01_013038 [Papaver californicum]|nr:hypothetical protein MKX01_013038 [Papaver californicum]